MESSANVLIFAFSNQLGMSFTYIKKKSGPSRTLRYTALDTKWI